MTKNKEEIKNVSQLEKWEKNPRQITPSKLRILAKTIAEFGDLSGFVYNTKLKRLVGGHQRKEILESAEIEIVERFNKPNKQGTLAYGFAVFNGEKFAYREVSWDEQKHAAAAIAANKGAGDWDMPMLKEILSEIDTGTFDMELTGFELNEIENWFGALDKGLTQNIDLSALDDGSSVDETISEMASNVRKAIQIDFSTEDYEHAQELVSKARSLNIYIGEILIKSLEKVLEDK